MTPDDRLKSVFRAIVREMLPNLLFLGCYEYAVVSQSGAKVSARILDPRVGLPDLVDVIMRPCINCGVATFIAGTSILVGFVNGDRARPYVAGGDPATIPQTSTFDASGTFNLAPTAGTVNVADAAAALNFCGGGQGVARLGDTVSVNVTVTGVQTGPGTAVGTGTGTITSASSKVKAGG